MQPAEITALFGDRRHLVDPVALRPEGAGSV
jgi:hypothetical protein